MASGAKEEENKTLLGQKREKLSRTTSLTQQSKKGKMGRTEQRNSAELFPIDGNGLAY